jgi:transcriptional regulator GlxA family with amidase domain
MSRRNYDRRFREIAGTAPATWLIHQRVVRAQLLVVNALDDFLDDFLG